MKPANPQVTRLLSTPSVKTSVFDLGLDLSLEELEFPISTVDADKAEAAGISLRTARKWLKRYEEQGLDGLADRSSRPRRTRETVDAALERFAGGEPPLPELLLALEVFLGLLERRARGELRLRRDIHCYSILIFSRFTCCSTSA